MNKTIRGYVQESIDILKEVIVNNELINGEYISYIGADETGKIIIIRDILNQEIQYSLSEVSYVFFDYLDCIGDRNRNIYETIINAKDKEHYEKYKNSFIKSLARLREIEQAV